MTVKEVMNIPPNYLLEDQRGRIFTYLMIEHLEAQGKPEGVEEYE